MICTARIGPHVFRIDERGWATTDGQTPPDMLDSLNGHFPVKGVLPDRPRTAAVAAVASLGGEVLRSVEEPEDVDQEPGTIF